MTRLLTLCLFALTVPSLAPAQTCTYPWTPDHDTAATFDVGAYYRSPYAEIIEVLADTCLGYDTLVNDDGTETPVCVPGLALRIVKGRPFLTSTRKSVVYLTGRETLAYASAVIPAETPVGSWGKLPVGCYEPSVVVSVRSGSVQVRVP